VSELLPPVVAVLTAELGGFLSGMGAAKAEMGKVETATTKLATVGKAAFIGLGIAAAGIAVESVKLASSFDQTMELIHTQAGASQKEVDGLKNSVLALAPTVGIGPDKLAEGLYHIESTGYRGKAAMDILAASAKLAAMGMADLDTVTFAMSGVMSSGMKDVKDAADATAYLNTIVGIGDMRMDKLAAAIGTGVLPSFKSAGLGMTDFGAALATITDNSTPADEAATRLRMTISLMAAPSQKATDALKSIGIGQSQLADDLRKPNGLLVAVMDLKTHLEKSGKSASEQDQIIEHAFGGGKTSGAILTLLEESDRLKSKYDALGTSGSRAAAMQQGWAAQQQQFTQQVHQLGAEAQVLGIKIGNFLIPQIQAVAGWLAKHIEVAKIAAIVIGSVLVAAMVAWTASVIANTVAMLANPTTWIILAIVAAVALLAIGIYELVKHWSTVWAWIKRIALDVWHWLVDAWHATWNVIMGVVHWIKSKIIDPIVGFFDKYLVAPIKFYMAIVADVWRFVWGFMSVIISDWMKGLRVIWAQLNTHIIQPGKGWLLDFYHWVDSTFIRPLLTLFRWVMKGVDDAWHGWLTVFNTAKGWLLDFFHWVDNTFIRPFVAMWDKVTGAIGKAFGAVKSFADNTSHLGGSFAHLLGFDTGGAVPGAPGAPMLAVVHGGEYVLSRDMISTIRQSRPVPGPFPMPIGQGAAPPGVIHLHVHNYLDGKELHQGLMPVAQRHKLRTGVTGLA
jgi:TP901 family phage tail tape measure protein